jgi:hypothetical protein
MKNLTKTIFTTLSYPDFGSEKVSYVNVIASIYLVDNNDIQDYNTMNNVLEFLDIKNLVIITISKKAKGEKILERYYKGEFSVIKNIMVSYDYFFSNIGIKKFLIEQEYNIEVFNKENNIQEIRPSFIIYRFEETTWLEIKSLFKQLNINIGGGSNVKRHLFSPLHLKLALFIICLEKSNSFKTV